MLELYCKEYLIIDIERFQIDTSATQKILSLKQNDLTVEQKKHLLLGLTEEEIMVGYYKFGLKNIYHLLPREYKKYQCLTFIACLCGDDISSMSKTLKDDLNYVTFLLYHIPDAVKYASTSQLTQDNNGLLNFYVGMHYRSIDKISQKYITKELLFLYVNKLRCLGYKKGDIVFSNVPDTLKEDKGLISLAYSIDPVLLLELDNTAVSKFVSKDDEIFDSYYKLLCEEQIKLMNIKDSLERHQFQENLDNIIKQEENINRMQSLLNERSSYLKLQGKKVERKKKRIDS